MCFFEGDIAVFMLFVFVLFHDNGNRTVVNVFILLILQQCYGRNVSNLPAILCYIPNTLPIHKIHTIAVLPLQSKQKLISISFTNTYSSISLCLQNE